MLTDEYRLNPYITSAGAGSGYTAAADDNLRYVLGVGFDPRTMWHNKVLLDGS